MPDFQPFVSPNSKRPEFTVRAILLGSFFGLVFGAVTVYVGLRAGLTVAASIPIAVLSISILRAFGRASILENNIVQTTGNAGQSIAAGVIFTLPALIFKTKTSSKPGPALLNSSPTSDPSTSSKAPASKPTQPLNTSASATSSDPKSPV